MQICIHRKDNSPKPVNHHLTLKEGTKVMFQVISTFNFDYPRLTLKEGSKVKSDSIKRFPAHDFL